MLGLTLFVRDSELTLGETVAREWGSIEYDSVYASGGAERIYDLPYRLSGYYPLFKSVRATSLAVSARSILEVGCGTGAGHGN